MDARFLLGAAAWIAAATLLPAQTPNDAAFFGSPAATSDRPAKKGLFPAEATSLPDMKPIAGAGAFAQLPPEPEPADHPPQEDFWIQAEYLLWWTRGQAFPPLVTTSPVGTPLAIAGLLGQPTTTVLFGGERDDADLRSGVRITAGGWLNQCQTLGLQFRYFQLVNEIEHFKADSNSHPIIILPFFDEEGRQRRRITSFPGNIQGNVALDTSSRLSSGEAELVVPLYRNCSQCRINALLGYRQMCLNEDFGFLDSETNLEGNNVTILDQFNTRNRFYGAELGLATRCCRDRWTLDLAGRVAFGCNDRHVNANGVTIFRVPGEDPVRQSGGFFALPSNIGRRDDNEFTVIPELNVGVGYQLTCKLRATFGYTFLYWPNAFRPGDQIDTTVNPTQLPSIDGPGTLVGPARPAPLLRGSDFWAQGLNFGLEFRY